LKLYNFRGVSEWCQFSGSLGSGQV
jgi:hypothetical protein